MWHEIIRIIIVAVAMRCLVGTCRYLCTQHARINESSKYFCSEGVFNKERQRMNIVYCRYTVNVKAK